MVNKKPLVVINGNIKIKKMNKLDLDYQNLLKDILENGTKKETRNGGTLSVFGRQIRHNMKDGFPAITTKKMAFKTMVTELLWFLRGSSDIRFLWENNCKIWDGDWEKNYKTTCSEPYTIEEVKQKVKDGNHHFNDSMFDMGLIYGKQWRSWRGKNGMIGEKDEDGVRVINWEKIDQIANLINDLKTNPDSRRLLVSAWNPADLPHQVLPPCHYGFQVYTRELSLEERTELAKGKIVPLLGSKDDSYDEVGIPRRAISLMWNQRSQDVPLGGPYNWASYGLLLEIIAKTVNMVPDELIINIGDAHIYLNQIDGVNEQLGRELSFEERRDLMVKYTQDNNLLPIPYILPFGEESKNKYLEICDKYKIPKRTREPYPLPTLKHMKTDEFYKSLGEDLSLLSHLTIDDFVLENYQSHPKIYFPLSN
jgi:thymidylate synthase